MILHNGTEYQDEDSIDWQTAMGVDGNYFGLARRLGLPSPPACFVFLDDDLKTSRQHLICGWYDALLNSARLDKILLRREVSYESLTYS